MMKGAPGCPGAQSFLSECGYFLGEPNIKIGSLLHEIFQARVK